MQIIAWCKEIIAGLGNIREPNLGTAGSPGLRELPPALVSFYQIIGAVVLPDIGNGHFIHSAEAVLNQLQEEGTVKVGGADAVVFASNGGGVLYAITPTGAIHRSSTASRDSDFELVATDLAGYLGGLRGVVSEFIRTGDPGKLCVSPRRKEEVMRWNLRVKAAEMRRHRAEAGLEINAGKMSALWTGAPTTTRLDDL